MIALKYIALINYLKPLHDVMVSVAGHKTQMTYCKVKNSGWICIFFFSIEDKIPLKKTPPKK